MKQVLNCHTPNSTSTGAMIQSSFHPKDTTSNITIINLLSKYLYIQIFDKRVIWLQY